MSRRSIRIAQPPEGFDYQPGIISLEDERTLVQRIRKLPLREFEFQGYLGKRRVTSFGWHYDFADFGLHQAEPIPDFLEPMRLQAAQFAGLSPNDLVHVLVTEYRPGTPIG